MVVLLHSCDCSIMRLGCLLVAIVFCGVCSGVPTDGTSASNAATASASTGASTSFKAPSVASGGGSSAATAPAGGSQQGDFDDDDDDDDDEPQITGNGFGLPLSSAILLSSHHGHHVCLPDVVAFSLLGSRGYPLSNLLPYHHNTPQRLQQELMFLKAFTKAGQHVWKTISSGHGKHPYQNLDNIAKVAGAISSGMNAFAGKGGHGPGAIASGLSSAAQHLVAPVH